MGSRSTNLAELEQKILHSDPPVQAVSFDVFDTLVQRTLPHPDVTKIPASRKLFDLLGQAPAKLSIEALYQMRIEVEMGLRKKAVSMGLDPECRIDDVFREWVASNGLPPSDELVKELITTELQSEFSVVFPTKGMVDLIRKLNSQNIQLFYSTDMYLRKWMIEEILDRCGYRGCFTNGFVSCEVMKAKYSGKLFQYILQTEKIEADHLLHVGDRYEVDVQGAARASISSFHFIDFSERERQANQAYVNSIRKDKPFWNGARWCQMAVASEENRRRCELDLPYSLAYRYLGPFFAVFTHQVLNLVRNDAVDLVLFRASDGYLLKEIYLRIAKAFESSDLPPTRHAMLASYKNLDSQLPDYLDQAGHWKCNKIAVFRIGMSDHHKEVLSVTESKLPGMPQIKNYNFAVPGSKQFKVTDKSSFISVVNNDSLMLSAQTGILDFCEDYVRTLDFHDREPEAYSNYILFRLDRLIQYPTKLEAMILTRLSQTGAVGRSLDSTSKNAKIEMPEPTAKAYEPGTEFGSSESSAAIVDFRGDRILSRWLQSRFSWLRSKVLRYDDFYEMPPLIDMLKVAVAGKILIRPRLASIVKKLPGIR